MSLLADRKTPVSVRLNEAHEAERVSQTGAVGSVQEAEVTLPAEVLAQIWKREYLERLALAYWAHLRRVTLGLIRVVYRDGAPAAVLLSRRLPLLRFHPPEYEAGDDRGCVTWKIERGLLVAAAGRDQGYLRIRVQRPDHEPSDGDGERRLWVQLEVRNFYPWLRGKGRFARFGAWFYGVSQLRIHVLIGNAFLRSLARLDLPSAPGTAAGGELEAPARTGA